MTLLKNKISPFEYEGRYFVYNGAYRKVCHDKEHDWQEEEYELNLFIIL